MMKLRTVLALLLLALASGNFLKMTRQQVTSRYLMQQSSGESGESGEQSGESGSSSTGGDPSSSTGGSSDTSSSTGGSSDTGGSNDTDTSSSSTGSSTSDSDAVTELTSVKVTLTMDTELDTAGETTLKTGYQDKVATATAIAKSKIVVVLKKLESSGRRLLNVQYVLSAFVAKSLADDVPTLNNSTLTTLSESVVSYAKSELDITVTVAFTPDAVVTAPTEVPAAVDPSSSTGSSGGNDSTGQGYSGATSATMSAFAGLMTVAMAVFNL